MAEPIGFMVCTWNQASGQVEPDTGWSALHSDPADAVVERDALRAETAEVGRGERHEVCVVSKYLCDPCAVHTDPDDPIACTDPACACWCREGRP